MIRFMRERGNRSFLRMWAAQLISQFGDRLHQMALIGLIAERAPGSASGLAKLLAFTIVPVFIVGPVAGVFVDRWDHRRTLFFCDLLRGLLVLTIPLGLIDRPGMVPIYGVVFLAFCFSRFYVPAKMAIIPELVDERNLLTANSLMTTTGMIAFVLGCALGGFIVDAWGARGGFYGDAATFFISGILIFSIRRDLRVRIDPHRVLETGGEILRAERSVFGEIREGLRYLFGQAHLRFVMAMLFVLLSAAGAVYVVIIVFVQESFHSVTRDLGVLAVFLGLGLFSGAVGYGRWGRRVPWTVTICACLAGGGVMIGLFALVVHFRPSLGVAGVLAFILGSVIGPIFIASNTIVHMVSDEAMRGKVFSALEIVIHLAFLSAMLISSLLSDFVPRLWILVGVGAVFSLTGAVGFARLGDGGLVGRGRKMA